MRMRIFLWTLCLSVTATMLYGDVTLDRDAFRRESPEYRRNYENGRTFFYGLAMVGIVALVLTGGEKRR